MTTNESDSFRPWHIFALLSMAAAAAIVWVARDTQPLALVLLSAAVLAAGVVGYAIFRALTALFSGPGEAVSLPEHKREILLREKALTLRSIKELEFDRAMGKIGDADYAELSARLRDRALILMQDLEQADAQMPIPQPAAADPRAAVERPTCAQCGTVNEPDASFCKKCGQRIAAIVMMFLALWLGAPGPARAQMTPELLKRASGTPLPSPDLAPGNLSVRLLRGAVTNNIVGHPVEMTVDGKSSTMTTDASGRVELTGLKPGAIVKAVAVVDGERLESQEITIGTTGIRVMLVATDAAAAAASAAAPPIKGTVSFGPESRVIAEMRDDKLNIFYIFDIQNPAGSPVDIGGPVLIDLPDEARGASVLQESSKQATVGGTRVTVLGPFAPGSTPVQIAFELPYSGGTAKIRQRLPAALPQVIAIVEQSGGLDLVSPQIDKKREVVDQGARIIAGTGPALAAGQTLTLDITGLPHHPTWPRYVALFLAGSIVLLGIVAAVNAGPRRRTV